MASGNCNDSVWLVVSSSLSLCPPPSCFPLPPSTFLSSLHTCSAEADSPLGSYPLYSHLSMSPKGLWGPHSSLALSLEPISVFTCRSPGGVPDSPCPASTTESGQLRGGNWSEPQENLTQHPNSCPSVQTSPGQPLVAPRVPAPLPTQPLLWLTGPNLSCLHAASPPSLGSPDADTF